MSRLTDETEVPLRQVHRSWRNDDGTLTRQVFKPTPKDGGHLSVDRSAKTNAGAAFDAHQQFGVSVAVVGVTVGEVDAAGSSAHDDPVPNNAPTDELGGAAH